LKTAILWKIAPRRDESTIFKVLEGLETLLFCYFFGYGFWMASGMDFLWFLGGFEVSFGSQNQYKTSSISGSIFGADSENPQSENPSKISSAKTDPLKIELSPTREHDFRDPTHVTTTCSVFFGVPFWGHFFDEKRVFFDVVFWTMLWIAFLLIFHAFGMLFESFFGVFLIFFWKHEICEK